MKRAKLKEENVSYEQYCAEIGLRERNELISPWEIKNSLTDKVDEMGRYKPFFGDTIVYTLPADEQLFFYSLQKQLRVEFSDLLAAPLDYKQFHITIHDLANSTQRELISKNMLKNSKECQIILRKFRKRSSCEIDVQSTTLFPSKKTAVIMGFVPCSDADYQKMLEVYNLFEKICPLDYWPHLHVTLNYFLPKVPIEARVKELNLFCKEVSATSIKLRLNLLDMTYQHFEDMNNYSDVI